MLAPPLNPLARPFGRAPGFDPTHIAAGTICGLSAVARSDGASMYSVVNPFPPTFDVDPQLINGILGPNVGFGNSNKRIDFRSNLGSANSVTCAAIVRWDSSSSPAGGFACCVESDQDATGGLLMYVDAGTGRLGAYAPDLALSAPNAGVVLTAGENYFIGISAASGYSCVYYAKHMRTGAVQFGATAAVAGNPITCPSGNARVGNNNILAGQSFGGVVAAAMVSNAFLDVRQFNIWAGDPWSFWYPRPKIRNRVGAAAGFTPKFRKTFSPIGGRVGSRQPLAA